MKKLIALVMCMLMCVSIVTISASSESKEDCETNCSGLIEIGDAEEAKNPKNSESFPVSGTDDKSSVVMISDLELDSSISFLKNYEIEVPVLAFVDLEGAADFVLDVANKVIYDQNYAVSCSLVELADFWFEVIAAVVDYYQLNDSDMYVENHDPLIAEEYELQDSETIGSWQEIYRQYNCYSYALNRTNAAYDPGYFSGQDDDIMLYCRLANVDAIAELVEADLRSAEYGHDCIDISSTMPSLTSIDSDEVLICVRTTKKNSESSDYHFMRYLPNKSAWRHKPGNTAILKYLYNPSNARVWTNEYSINNTAMEGSIEYGSAIRYITFSPTHDFDYIYHSTTQHKKVCNDCGDTTYLSHVLNPTTGGCTLCGYSGPITAEIRTVKHEAILPQEKESILGFVE